MPRFPFAAALTGLALILTPGLAHADKGGHGHHRDYEQHYDHHDRDRPDVIIIDDRDRVVIRDYMRDDYRHRCPPGLAKKHNGCVPPGHVVRYQVGEYLPAEVVYRPAPPVIIERVRPAPVGYQYVQVDDDLLLINAASHKIIDAVTLLSAVN